MDKPYSFLIIDDHPMIINGYKTIIQSKFTSAIFHEASICLMYLLVYKTRFKVMYIYILTSLLSVVLCLLEARLKKEIVVILSCSLATVLLVCVLFKRIFGKIDKYIT